MVGGRVALSVRCEGRIETTYIKFTFDLNFFAYLLVSIRVSLSLNPTQPTDLP
jgi:hypothetical protein